MKNALSLLTLACLTAFAYPLGARADSGANLSIDASGQASPPSEVAVKSGPRSNAATIQADAATLSAGATIEAELTKAVDLRKAKPGDQVVAKVRADVKQNGQIVLHRGTKLIGHITQAQGKSSGQGSLLGILFDRAELKSGEAMELHAVIQALAPPPPIGQDSGAQDVGSSGAFTPGRSEADDTLEGRTQNARAAGQADRAAIIGATAQPSQPTGGPSPRGPVTSHEVMGIPGLRIDDQLSNPANGTVLVSDRKNIHLDSGTRLVIRVTGQPH